MTARDLACRSGFVERTRTRTVTEGLGSVAALTRIPLIDNHLDRHLASPHTARTLFLVCSRRKSPMTALPVDRKRRWNTAPRGRRGLFLSCTYSDLQIADLIEFNCLKSRIGNLCSAKIPRHSCSVRHEAVLMVKSVQDGASHNSACSVETMPMALQIHGESWRRIGKSWPQGRVWSASVVMREPRP